MRVQPGVLGGEANLALRSFGRKIGPDPASLAACALGGILANNASGKCCGVAQNAYHTLDSITFVLPSGTRIDTADPDADAQFRRTEPALADGLLALKRDIEAHPVLANRIRAKYRMKNTTGYGLNAFLDYATAVDIFSHLLIGSEGTLAFIAEAVLQTVPDLPHKSTGAAVVCDHRRGLRRDRATEGRGRQGARVDGPRVAAGGAAAARRAGRTGRPAAGRGGSARRVPGGDADALAAYGEAAARVLAGAAAAATRPRSPTIRGASRDCGACARACIRRSVPSAAAAPP